MIERFDFYDIYGYLIPGAALMVVAWLPIGIVGHHWPPAEWSSALLVAVLAYIAGLFLHGLAAHALPESRLHERGRYPSASLLDSTDKFLKDRKSTLVTAISTLYGVDVNAGEDNKAIDRRRNDAFLMCRTVLQAKELAGYAEHQQGLYTLMRGLTAAFWGGAAYLTGWAIGGFALPAGASLAAFLVVVILCLIFVAGENAELSFWLALPGGLLTGIVLGARFRIHGDEVFSLIVIATGLLALSTRAYAAYRYFTVKFAESVYLAFLAVTQAHLLSAADLAATKR